MSLVGKKFKYKYGRKGTYMVLAEWTKGESEYLWLSETQVSDHGPFTVNKGSLVDYDPVLDKFEVGKKYSALANPSIIFTVIWADDVHAILKPPNLSAREVSTPRHDYLKSNGGGWFPVES